MNRFFTQLVVDGKMTTPSTEGSVVAAGNSEDGEKAVAIAVDEETGEAEEVVFLEFLVEILDMLRTLDVAAPDVIAEALGLAKLALKVIKTTAMPTTTETDITECVSEWLGLFEQSSVLVGAGKPKFTNDAEGT
jgi:hypothetical protein